jgi:hypothetical protein
MRCACEAAKAVCRLVRGKQFESMEGEEWGRWLCERTKEAILRRDEWHNGKRGETGSYELCYVLRAEV